MTNHLTVWQAGKRGLHTDVCLDRCKMITINFCSGQILRICFTLSGSSPALDISHIDWSMWSVWPRHDGSLFAHLFARNWLGQTFIGNLRKSHAKIHMLVYTCAIVLEYTHKPKTSNPTFQLWKSPGLQAFWEIISQASKRGNSITLRRKKSFFNGEKWQAGEELAAAARIIDGNCLGTRLRFMGRTTHWGLGENGMC